MTKADYGDWDEVLANIPPNPFDQDLSQVRWDNVDLEGEPGELAADSESAPLLATASNYPYALPGTAPAPVTPTKGWQSPEQAKRRQILLIATIGVVGSILAVLGFWSFLRFMNTSAPTAMPPVAQGPTEPSQVEPPTTVPPTSDPDSIDSESPNVAPDLTPDREPDSPPESGATVEGADPTLPEEKGLVPEVPPGPSKDPVGLTDFLHASDDPPIASAETPSPTDTNQDDPTDAEKGVSDRLPDIFGPAGFGQLLTPQLDMGEKASSGASFVNELDLENFDEPLEVQAHPSSQLVPPWSDKTTNFTIARWRVQELSLSSCVDFFARISGIGITIDWPELRAAGIDEALTVSFDAKEQTIDGLIRSLLAKHQLQLEIPDDGHPLVRPALNGEAPSQVSTWDLQGLVAAGEEQALADDLVEQWGFHDSCRPIDGKLQWQSNATSLQKGSMWTSLVLLARVQKRPIPTWPESSKEPLMLFDPEDWNGSREALKRGVTSELAIPEARSVTEILLTAAQETRVGLLIDWQSVWQHGLVPTQTAVSVLKNRTLQQVSRRFRDQYSLELVVIGKDRVQLTTPEARRTRYCVIPIHLPEEMELDDLKRSLYRLAPSTLDGRTRFRVVKVAGTERVCLARLTLPTPNQLEDSELIAAFGW